MSTRIQISFTYNCNLSCEYCLQYSDCLKWDDKSYVSCADLDIAVKKIKDNKIEISDIRISGGEPTIHPQFEEFVYRIRDTWQYSQIIICTNGVLEMPKIDGVRYRASYIGHSKLKRHQPPMYSPDDLGFSCSYTTPVRCRSYTHCGSLFDAFGFAACCKAGTLGRLLRIDPYSINPVVDGNMDMSMCKHCFISLGADDRKQVHKDINNGKIEYPTKTFREGLKLDKENPFVFKTFQQRLEEEV